MDAVAAPDETAVRAAMMQIIRERALAHPAYGNLKDFAKALGVSHDGLLDNLSGRSEIRLTVALRAATLLGMDLADLETAAIERLEWQARQ